MTIADSSIEDAIAFVRRVADTPYDGRPCSHDDGCHDHDECVAAEGGCGWECHDGADTCCEPVDMGNDETHDALVDIVQAAQALIATMPQ